MTDSTVTEAQAVRRAVDARRDFALAALRSLLAASRDGEQATQSAVRRLLDELGWRPRELRRRPTDIATADEFAHPNEIDHAERVTIIAERPDTDADANPALLLWAHPDGMPFDGAPGWRHEPFAGVSEGGRMYGWGIADDLSGVAAMIAVAAVLGDLPGEPARVIVASTPSKGHASGVLAALAELENVGAGIYLHPAESGRGLGDVKAVAPGMLRLRIIVPGRPPGTQEPNHTLYADSGVDPIEPMMRVLAALREFNRARGRADAKMLVGTLRCGDSISRLPAACEAVVTFSMPPGADLAATRAAVADVIAGTAEVDSWLGGHPPVVEWLFGTTGVAVEEEHPLIVAVRDAVSAVTGQVPRYYGGHIASEIRQPLLNYGIPCVGIGPRSGSLAQAGSRSDEWLDVEDYLRMIAVCTLAALRWHSGQAVTD